MVLVAVQLFVPGLYLPPVFNWLRITRSAPDNHLAAGPDSRVTGSRGRRVGSASRCPTVRARIVSPAGL